jgi:hypothetical protein
VRGQVSVGRVVWCPVEVSLLLEPVFVWRLHGCGASSLSSIDQN